MQETEITMPVKNATYHNNKCDLFTSFDVQDFDVPKGRDEVWRFVPLSSLRGLHDGTFAEAVSPDVAVDVPEGADVTVERVSVDDDRIGRAGGAVDRVGAQAWTAA